MPQLRLDSIATWIFVVNLAASLVALYARPGWIDRGVFRPFQWPRRGGAWTPLTSAFLHADLPHLLFNMVTFWFFAFPLERRLGVPMFAALYAFGILVSTVGTWWTHRTEPQYATLGASGAILAVLFASILYFPSQSLMILPIPIPIPAPVFALGYLAYTWYSSRQNRGRVNHDAHLSGALAGVAFVALTDLPTLLSALERFAGR
jgi:membrane associated rhomboid family serine protease